VLYFLCCCAVPLCAVPLCAVPLCAVPLCAVPLCAVLVCAVPCACFFRRIAGTNNIRINGMFTPPVPPAIPPSAPPPIPPATPGQPSCKNYADAGSSTSGVYQLIAADGSFYDNYCDMNADGGGWTLVVKALEASGTLHRSKTPQWQDGTLLGSTSTLVEEDALGKSYDSVSFTDVMIRSIKGAALGAGLVSWRHSTTYTSMKSVVNACTQISGGTLIAGNFNEVACVQNSAGSIPSSCTSSMNRCSSNKYGFFISEHGSANAAGGCASLGGTYAGSVVGGGTLSPEQSCLSSWGIGSGYSDYSATSTDDQHWGINYHWWGAGNYRLGANVPIASVGVFVR